ncbi:tRNA (N6-isopentenyl adenosine(37)-C2)-methylthiotransferase MiaB [Oscillospiraceae bacterium OttesenSCG-928-F05]|nr:tRNA (N6-isopentenyl adenosine(37)-C2)-methylthiotransferase MiaB [Oscillospiraceae bacterium OttesenSCG-928-F05]
MSGHPFLDPESQGRIHAAMEAVKDLHGGATAVVDTYGCQQNEADSERMRGMLTAMGYTLTAEMDADVVVINTCAIRENAEQRVYGNLGYLSHTKKKNPGQKIILTGCMPGSEAIRARIRKSYRHVDALIDAPQFWRLPEVLLRLLTGEEKVYLDRAPPEGTIAEGLPVERLYSHKAWVSVMYGCNNFCTYCIVPHVRGRERSRKHEDVLREIAALAEAGCRDVTLLGQNVNSYGSDREGELSFPELLAAAGEIPGEFRLRFMTSHPKDAGEALFSAMAETEKVAKQLHLPVQSGSDAVLAAMNRRYTAEHYLSLVEDARRKMPDITLTSDIIVGFPGETEADFLKTLDLIRAVRYEALFTFVFSPRAGTPAAGLDDPVPREEKMRWFDELCRVQNGISAEKHAARVGETMRVLIDEVNTSGPYTLAGRTDGGRLVHMNGGADLVGSYRKATITGSSTWTLFGELCKSEEGQGK